MALFTGWICPSDSHYCLHLWCSGGLLLTISNILFTSFRSRRISSLHSLQSCLFLCHLVSFSFSLSTFCAPSESLLGGTAAWSSSVTTKTPVADSELSSINRLPGKDACCSSRQGSLFWSPSSQMPLQTCHSSDVNWVHWCPSMVWQSGLGRHLPASLLWDTYNTIADTGKPSLVPAPLTVLSTCDSTWGALNRHAS